MMNEHPDYQLQLRFGDTDLGDLPHEFTDGPDDLMVISGAHLTDYGVHIADFSKVVPQRVSISLIMMYVGLVVMLFPVLLLISISATLGSVQRQQRYAALRLVGATTRQILNMLIVEALAGAILGYVLGLLIFFLAHPLFALIPIVDGNRFWAENLSITPLQAGIVAVATVALVVVSHAWGMRQIHLSPLGVTRRQKPGGRPSWLRVIPLLLSIALFGYELLSVDVNSGSANDAYILMGGVLALMVSLLIVSPWLIYIVAWLSARFARKAPTIIGLTYVKSHAKRISRAVAGVVLAVFAGSFFLGAISQVDEVLAANTTKVQALLDNAVVISGFDDEATAQRLEAIVANEDMVTDHQVFPLVASSWTVFDCGQADRFIDMTCSDGIVGVNFWSVPSEDQSLIVAHDFDELTNRVNIEYNADTMHTSYSTVVTLRDHSDLEHFYSILATTHLVTNEEETYIFSGGEQKFVTPMQTIKLLSYLVYVGIAVTIVVAIISMLVSTYAGLLERRRSLLTLRLSGMKTTEITRMMFIETVGPLALLLIISGALGFGAAWVLLQIFSVSLSATADPILGGILVVALALAGGAISALSPTMRRITQPANNRQE